VAPDRLTLEITEDGVVGRSTDPCPPLRRLHEVGVRLAVDDFGTGYSSLSYLRRLPVHG
jgi:EAL domain-containing protein (putative c-di-GMP-specific phosphodiesterase class I)